VNAAKQGVHSPRLIQARAAEIATELTQSFEFSPAERLAVHEAARCIAILEAIDRDLDQRGLVDKEGKPRYLLNHRSRTSRQLEHWLEKVSAAMERKAASEQAPSRADLPDYVRALQRIKRRGFKDVVMAARVARALAWPQSTKEVANAPCARCNYHRRPRTARLDAGRGDGVTGTALPRRLGRRDGGHAVADPGR
jgi:hypothetical protein